MYRFKPCSPCHFSRSGRFLFTLIRCYPKHRIFLLYQKLYLDLLMEGYNMYSQEEKDIRFEEVCKRIEKGEPLRRILRSESAPLSQTVFYELLKDPVKNVRYARAREIYADNVFEEMLDIADCEDNDIIETEEGPRVNHDVIQRDRLRVDTRKWMLSKLAPKKYGDRLEVDQKTEATITWKEEKTYEAND